MTDDEAMKLTSLSHTETFLDYVAWIEIKLDEKGYKGIVSIVNAKARCVNVIYHLTLKNKPIRQFEITIPFIISKEDLNDMTCDVILIPSAVRERLRYIKEKRNETQG